MTLADPDWLNNPSRELHPVVLDPASHVYAVGQEKPLLAGMPFPTRNGIWVQLKLVGLESVVCLSDLSPGYNPWPLRLLAAVQLQDLAGGRKPDDPGEQERRIRSAVKSIITELHNDRSVVVHCVGGTGRTGTVIACAMRELGMPTQEVLAAMTRINELRGRGSGGWPESEWQRAVVVNW